MHIKGRCTYPPIWIPLWHWAPAQPLSSACLIPFSLNYLDQQGLEPHVYYEAAAVIISLILLGRYFEERAKFRTSGSIRKLMGLGVKTATVMRNGQELEIPADQVIKGDVILVRPGDKIPVDGRVI